MQMRGSRATAWLCDIVTSHFISMYILWWRLFRDQISLLNWELWGLTGCSDQFYLVLILEHSIVWLLLIFQEHSSSFSRSLSSFFCLSRALDWASLIWLEVSWIVASALFRCTTCFPIARLLLINHIDCYVSGLEEWPVQQSVTTLLCCLWAFARSERVKHHTEKGDVSAMNLTTLRRVFSPLLLSSPWFSAVLIDLFLPFLLHILQPPASSKLNLTIQIL